MIQIYTLFMVTIYMKGQDKQSLEMEENIKEYNTQSRKILLTAHILRILRYRISEWVSIEYVHDELMIINSLTTVVNYGDIALEEIKDIMDVLGYMGEISGHPQKEHLNSEVKWEFKLGTDETNYYNISKYNC